MSRSERPWCALALPSPPQHTYWFHTRFTLSIGSRHQLGGAEGAGGAFEPDWAGLAVDEAGDRDEVRAAALFGVEAIRLEDSRERRLVVHRDDVVGDRISAVGRPRATRPPGARALRSRRPRATVRERFAAVGLKAKFTGKLRGAAASASAFSASRICSTAAQHASMGSPSW